MLNRFATTSLFVAAATLAALGGCDGAHPHNPDDDDDNPGGGSHGGGGWIDIDDDDAGTHDHDPDVDENTGESGTGTPLPVGSTTTVAVLETTDIHSNIRSYDYFKLADDKTIGLERTATLIDEARHEFPNTILVDDGDTIQGTVLADYQALVHPAKCSDTLAVYKAMNQLDYDVGGIGNHEFNYGLGFLGQVTHTAFDVDGLDTKGFGDCKGPDFPLVNSNVYSLKTKEGLFKRSLLLDKAITAKRPDGSEVHENLRVGFLGFTPPPITAWDKRWLDEKVYTRGVKDVAEPLVKAMRDDGADLVIAIIHGGLDSSAYTPELENQAWYLAQVSGIDAMLMGHSHQVFPNAKSSVPQFGLDKVDKVHGFVEGVPSVMANFWGQHLGVIKLGLKHDGRDWKVDPDKTVVEARPISTTCLSSRPVACDEDEKWATGATCIFAGECKGVDDNTRITVDADSSIAKLVEAEHEATIDYVKTPIGTTDYEMTTYFADVGDVAALQIVNQAQADYVEHYIEQNLPQYNGLPVLSVTAPFKSGFQGKSDYTDVKAGSLAINNAADLYLYANTVYAVKLTGAELKDWLEAAATRFNQISPTVSSTQQLINQGVPGYNFDVITDPRLSYEIDVSEPLPSSGNKAKGRIKNLTFLNQPLDLEASFIVATNNYRASGGGSFPGLDGSKTIWASPDSSRDVLIAYIKKTENITRAKNGSDRSWHFSKVPISGPVVFSSAQGALPLATAAGLNNIRVVETDDGSGKSLSTYAIDLNQ